MSPALRSFRPCVAPIAFALIAGLAVLLGGCVTKPVEGRDYIAPMQGASPVATIRGSAAKEGSMFASAGSACVLMVDYLNVLNASDNIEHPLVLAPGSHHITAQYSYSNFVSRATFKLNVLPGVAYQVKYEATTDTATDRRYCDFWIIDTATGATVGARQHQQVSGGRSKSSSLFRPD